MQVRAARDTDAAALFAGLFLGRGADNLNLNETHVLTALKAQATDAARQAQRERRGCGAARGEARLRAWRRRLRVRGATSEWLVLGQSKLGLGIREEEKEG
jgi:hypothetical protein